MKFAVWLAVSGAALGIAGVASAADAAKARSDLPLVTKAPQTAQESVSPQWTTTFASEVRYYSWTSNRGSPTGVNLNPGSGTQVYVPYALQLVGSPSDQFKVELLGRGGWVRSRQSTLGLTGEVDTATDTVASGTVTYLGLDGVQPFASLNVNIPTGTAALAGSAANARLDPDLVEISSFGEGWNIGPTIGFNLPITPDLIFTTSAGYTLRGSFDRENSLTPLDPTLPPSTAQVPTSLKPGEVLTLTAALASRWGAWSSQLLGSLSEETKTFENGIALYKPGRRYLAAATMSYGWPETWGVTTLNAAIAHSDRNDVLFLGAPALVTEPFNTNSNVYRVDLQHLVPLGPIWLGPTGSYLHRDKNSYNTLTLQYVPAKERIGAGMIARYAATDQVTFNLRAERVWTREDEKDAINGQVFSVLADAFVKGSAVPVVSGDAWQVLSGLNVRF
ncbi:hypothetical protein [Bradyrhizobium sp. URHD0069]|uniref:hypothetical protein n=1 Tax=Bradyrhizobium sp. URHD0069 TaxID=1380355 RepID=UPI00049619A2|nr:hypothetical protein [Bradyrhizobium sp. URHD0069]